MELPFDNRWHPGCCYHKKDPGKDGRYDIHHPRHLAERVLSVGIVGARDDIFLVKLTVGTTTTSSVDVNKVTLENDTLIETFRYIPLTKAKDGDTGTHEFVTLTTDDYIYVMFDEKFNKVIFDFATANTADAGLTGEYLDGSI